MRCSCSPTTKIWASTILVIVIIGALTAFAYTSEQHALKSAAEKGMKSTVAVMATQVNDSDIAGIRPGDETSSRYIAVAKHLQTMRSMDDHIINAYILKVNPDRTITFLVDDLYPQDPQGSARIGEVSTDPDQLEIYAALSGPTVSKAPYTTKYGSFMSAYAPIDDSVNDSTGNTTAILGIDLSAKDYDDFTSQGNLILLTGIVSICLAVGAIFFFGSRRDEAEKPE
jgi:hypothetical protein